MHYSHYMTLVAVLFILFLPACGEDDPVVPQSDHEEAIGLALFRADSLVFSILRGIPDDTLRIAAGSTSEDYEVRFYNDAENIFEAHDSDKTFSWEIEDATIVEVLQDTGKEGKFELRLHGLKSGTTSIEFFILHQGHADFRSGKWPVLVQ